MLWALWPLRIGEGGWGRGSVFVKHGDAGKLELPSGVLFAGYQPFFTAGLRLPVCEVDAGVPVTVTDTPPAKS